MDKVEKNKLKPFNKKPLNKGNISKRLSQNILTLIFINL